MISFRITASLVVLINLFSLSALADFTFSFSPLADCGPIFNQQFPDLSQDKIFQKLAFEMKTDVVLSVEQEKAAIEALSPVDDSGSTQLDAASKSKSPEKCMAWQKLLDEASKISDGALIYKGLFDQIKAVRPTSFVKYAPIDPTFWPDPATVKVVSASERIAEIANELLPVKKAIALVSGSTIHVSSKAEAAKIRDQFIGLRTVMNYWVSNTQAQLPVKLLTPHAHLQNFETEVLSLFSDDQAKMIAEKVKHGSQPGFGMDFKPYSGITSPSGIGAQGTTLDNDLLIWARLKTEVNSVGPAHSPADRITVVDIEKLNAELNSRLDIFKAVRSAVETLITQLTL